MITGYDIKKNQTSRREREEGSAVKSKRLHLDRKPADVKREDWREESREGVKAGRDIGTGRDY